MGPQGDIVVPAIPACEIVRTATAATEKRGTIDDDDGELEEASLEQWPINLRKPLIKVPFSRRKAYQPKVDNFNPTPSPTPNPFWCILQRLLLVGSEVAC